MYAFNSLGAALFLSLYAYPYLTYSKDKPIVKALVISSVIIMIRIAKVEFNL